jgi:hypothetical protein
VARAEGAKSQGPRLPLELLVIDGLCSNWAKWAGTRIGTEFNHKSLTFRMLEWHELGLSPERLYPGPSLDAPPPGAMIIEARVAKMVKRLRVPLLVEYFTAGSRELKASRIPLPVWVYRQNLIAALWNLHGYLEASLDFSSGPEILDRRRKPG